MQWTNLETKICDLHGLISLLLNGDSPGSQMAVH